MKDPIVLSRNTINDANPFTKRFSDLTTLAIPVGVPLNVYNYTSSVGIGNVSTDDLLDAKHCRINALINHAGSSYEIRYRNYQVVPSRGDSKDKYFWSVYLVNSHNPQDITFGCSIQLDVKTGCVFVSGKDPIIAGVMMQFRYE